MPAAFPALQAPRKKNWDDDFFYNAELLEYSRAAKSPAAARPRERCPNSGFSDYPAIALFAFYIYLWMSEGNEMRI